MYSEADVERLVRDNLGLVVFIAKKFRVNSLSSLEDYIQAGLIGLVKAIRKFDAERGALPQYMYLCIKQEIIHESHKSTNVIHPIPLIEASNDLIRYDLVDYTEYLPEISEHHKTILYLRYAENYTLKEIGEQMGCSKQRIKQILTTLLDQIKESNFE